MKMALPIGGPLNGQEFGLVGNMQMFITDPITVYGYRDRIAQQIDGLIGSGREYMASTRTSNMGNGSMGGYSGPVGGGWTISSYEKPGGSYVRDIPILGGLADAGWVALQSLTRTKNPTHIDGTLVEGQERMESFVIVSSTILTAVASRLLIAARAVSMASRTLPELQATARQNASLFRQLFGNGKEGAQEVLKNINNVKIPNGLTKEAMQAYRELINRVPDPTGTQALRAQILDHLLK